MIRTHRRGFLEWSRGYRLPIASGSLFTTLIRYQLSVFQLFRAHSSRAGTGCGSGEILLHLIEYHLAKSEFARRLIPFLELLKILDGHFSSSFKNIFYGFP